MREFRDQARRHPAARRRPHRRQRRGGRRGGPPRRPGLGCRVGARGDRGARRTRWPPRPWPAGCGSPTGSSRCSRARGCSTTPPPWCSTSAAVAAVGERPTSPRGGVSIRLLVALRRRRRGRAGRGLLTRWALAALRIADTPRPPSRLAVPFLAYLLAEQVHGSGVLAVLTLGLYLRSYGHQAVTSGGWLLGRAVWEFADYLITNLVFVLIGFELTAVLAQQPPGCRDGHPRCRRHRDARRAAARLGVPRGRPGPLPGAGSRAGDPRRGGGSPSSPGGPACEESSPSRRRSPCRSRSSPGSRSRTATRSSSWASRAVLVTLVLQGLTLSPLVRRLHVGSTGRQQPRGGGPAGGRAALAAVETIRASTEREAPEPVRAAALLQYEGYVAAQDALVRARGDGPDDDGEDGTAPRPSRSCAPGQRDRALRGARGPAVRRGQRRPSRTR